MTIPRKHKLMLAGILFVAGNVLLASLAFWLMFWGWVFDVIA
ncbi:hypothetical protein [Vibrio phage LP.1]|nr:hypothetical protein [Vibrio phage LP.1]